MSIRKKIVVIGGSGRIGAQTVALLRASGHLVVAASRRMGVDIYSGEGLDGIMAGTDVVIDVSDAPSPAADIAFPFFQQAGANLVAAEIRAGVGHHVTLSIVGVNELKEQAYFRAKTAQEHIAAASDVPHTIVRATQFFEFLPTIVEGHTVNGVVQAPDALFQPIAASDVAQILADIALHRPRNAVVDAAGPHLAPFETLLRQYLRLTGDGRPVVTPAGASYFGQPVNDMSLVPRREFRIGTTSLNQWFAPQRRAA
ncbi:NmrA family protein [Ancylobacter novellus DSM 506]|uniref:NmrA family protein n=1 Tax=Ancylobacter novellus (strain ATCC 8093 / DSM 506 / JCM 20403 / CCM 1077 / IAM 12100 / NBRC 12443 / NCIMB 10456) TaxID=639283 RepID=D7A584_ANCN5|nr:SDR family oxidoreductase [Ancylobacter novellus]ADH89972.1 NmrA family protein [Ancylobacter novellus DSM 506]